MLSEEELKTKTKEAIEWIKEYVNSSGAKGVVVGDSGGKDSACVIAMSAKALGKENVLAISMPCNSIQSDYDDAKLVAEAFDVKFIKKDLTKTYINLEQEINQDIEKIGLNEITKEAKINIKPRLRMITLYAIAQSLGYLVIGTGNLCESMVGYTTKWGDSASDFNPIANFTVPEVLKICEMLGVPEKIIKKEPNDGLGGKTDEEKLGVKYSQIAEMIEKGNTEENAKKIIIQKYRESKHKREAIPIFDFERKNYLKNNLNVKTQDKNPIGDKKEK